jgi:hypothetical protein
VHVEGILKIDKQPARISPRVAMLAGGMIVLLLVAISIPNLLRSRVAADQAAHYGATRPAMEAESSAGGGVDARRVVQTGTMRLTVVDPPQTAVEVAAIAGRRGGFVEHSQVFRGNGQSSSAQITLRIPADMFDHARADIRQLAKEVEHEETGMADVTAQSVDLGAALRNYRAEEAQYLAIMQRAASVKDTLEVAQRLSDVRGRIERTQARINALSRQVEMAALTVSVQAESAPAPPWSPLLSFRNAWRDVLAGFADYVDAMAVVLLKIPLALAWALTVCALAAMAWHILRWIWKRWFVPQTQQA